MAYHHTYSFTFLILLFAIASVSAQQQQQTTPLEKRHVYGTVVNERNEAILGATVSLSSPYDTLQTVLDANGFYEFKEVRSADFLLTVKAMGYDTYYRRYYNNDTKAILPLPTIRLGVKVEELEEVMISRLRGSVVRGDTTEFWAADYIVRDFARVKDLLMRMEGITIDENGTVFHNGKEVAKALFNNEVYFSGSVKEAISELPADIVDRIQIIDRAADGESARRLQSEESTKVMNIISKADKTSGKMLDIQGEGGTQSRMRGKASYRQIDGANQSTLSLGHHSYPGGIRILTVPGTIGSRNGQMDSSDDPSRPPETGGRHRNTDAALGHSLVWGKFTLTPTYSFDHQDQQSDLQAYSERYFDGGTLISHRERERQYRQQFHQLAARGQSPPDENNVRGSLEVSYRRSDESIRQTDFQSGIIENREQEHIDRTGEQRRAAFRLSVQRTLGDRMYWSADGFSSILAESDNDEIRTAVWSSEDPGATPDSSVHQMRGSSRHFILNTASSRLSWGIYDRLTTQISLGVEHRFSLTDRQSNVLEGAEFVPNPSLSEYNDQHHLSIPVSVAPEYRFPSGFFLAPALEMNNHWAVGKYKAGTPDLARHDFFWNPSLSLGVRNNSVGDLSVKVGQVARPPAIQTLNPDPVYRTPFRIEIGDPDLRSALEQNLSLQYSRLFRKAAFNLFWVSNFTRSIRGFGIDRSLEIDPVANVIITRDQRVNVRGGNRQSHRLGLTQTLGRIQSTLKYTGTLGLNDEPYYANGERERRESLVHHHDLSFFYRTSAWLDVTPELRYRAQEDRNSLALFNNGRTHHRMFLADLKLAFYLPAQIRINVDLSQSLYETTNIMSNTSPFVVNANIETRLLGDSSMVLSFVVMDAARQNRYTAHDANEFGYTNTVTNPNSRYYLLQLSWRPEYWSRSRHDTGQGRKRDGSFVR